MAASGLAAIEATPPGALFVMSEVIDFAFENPLFLSGVALVSFYVGLEASGYGVICKFLYQRRVKKWNNDLVRVRELQEQLGVLRAVRAKRKQEAARKKKKTESAKAKDADRSKPKKEPKVRFSKKEVKALLPDQSPLSDPDTEDSSTECVDEAAVGSTGDGNSESVKEENNGDLKEQDATEDGDEFGEIPHAASDVYEGVKDAWTWGRHETPLSPLLGLAEGITTKTAEMFGTDMKGIDDALKPHVAGLDNILHGRSSDENKPSNSSNQTNSEET